MKAVGFDGWLGGVWCTDALARSRFKIPLFPQWHWHPLAPSKFCPMVVYEKILLNGTKGKKNTSTPEKSILGKFSMSLICS